MREAFGRERLVGFPEAAPRQVHVTDEPPRPGEAEVVPELLEDGQDRAKLPEREEDARP